MRSHIQLDGTATLDIALSEEEGVRFAAILWFDGLGRPPFQDPVALSFTDVGFSLISSNPIGVIPIRVDQKTRDQMRSRHIVILYKENEEYLQLSVIIQE